jgi:hypothetical protein
LTWEEVTKKPQKENALKAHLVKAALQLLLRKELQWLRKKAKHTEQECRVQHPASLFFV